MSRPRFTTRFPLTAQPRGLRSYVWRLRDTMALLGLLAVSQGLVAAAHDGIMSGWHYMLAWAWPRLDLGSSELVLWGVADMAGLSLPLVLVQLPARAPGPVAAIFTGLFGGGLWLGSCLLPRDVLPLRYFLRLMGLLCVVSVLGWLWLPASIGMSPQAVVNQLLMFGVGLLWFIPLLHALVLYIFPLSLVRQFMATVHALALVALSVPLQAGAIAWLLTHTSSLMVLPIYLLITFLPQVVIQLGLYGYFVSLTPAPSA